MYTVSNPMFSVQKHIAALGTVLSRNSSTGSSFDPSDTKFIDSIKKIVDLSFIDDEPFQTEVELDSSSVASSSTLEENLRNMRLSLGGSSTAADPVQPRMRSEVVDPEKYSKKTLADFIEYFMKLIKKHENEIIDGLTEQEQKKNYTNGRIKFLMNCYLDEEALSTFDDKFFDSSPETLNFWSKHSKENNFKCVGGPMSCVNWWLQLKVKDEKTCSLTRAAELRKIKFSSFVKYDERNPSQYRVFLNAQYI